MSRLIEPGDVTTEFYEKAIQFLGTFHGLQPINSYCRSKAEILTKGEKLLFAESFSSFPKKIKGERRTFFDSLFTLLFVRAVDSRAGGYKKRSPLRMPGGSFLRFKLLLSYQILSALHISVRQLFKSSTRHFMNRFRYSFRTVFQVKIIRPDVKNAVFCF